MRCGTQPWPFPGYRVISLPAIIPSPQRMQPGLAPLPQAPSYSKHPARSVPRGRVLAIRPPR